MPLWAQVHEDLRARLLAGEFDHGFPGEVSLTEAYEVSRHTIREAMRILTEEGLIQRERGRGTKVTPSKYQQNLGALYSLFDSMTAQGIEQHSRVLRLASTVNGVVASKLQAPPDTELVVLERVRITDHEPLAVDTSWLPAAIAEPLLQVDFHTEGLYAQLEQLCGVRVESGTERATAINAPRHIAELLHIGADAPLLMIERLACVDGVPIEWRETYIRGDRFSLESTWAPPRLRTPARQDSGMTFTQMKDS